MHLLRRVVPGISIAVLVLPMCVGPSAARAGAVTAGQLAYITTDGALNLVTVTSDGTTTSPQQLGPVTQVTSPETVKASAMVASGDGKWLAWSEAISQPDPTYGSMQVDGQLVVRNMTTGDVVSVHSEDYPLGFAGHTLVAVGSHTQRLVMTPSPHLVTIHDGDAYAVAAYPHGIVDVVLGLGGKNDTVETDRLRLTTFSGHHTLIHVYKVGTDYRSAAANFDVVSPDGTKLLIERGNHQDFEGLGPSSLFDTFSLGTSTHVRHALGHYGTDAAHWRMAGATFAGPKNTPWLALHSGYGSKADGYRVRGVVVAYRKGEWKLEASGGIAVAGNKAGYVVVQGGTWDPVPNSPDGEYTTSPTFEALLKAPDGTHHTLAGIRATQLLWVG